MTYLRHLSWQHRLILLVTAFVLVPLAVAQNAGADNYVTLEPGFFPDPYSYTSSAGGPIPAANYDSFCTGNITQDPSFILYLNEFDYLRVEAISAEDTTLLMYRVLADGSRVDTRCDDDTLGFNPLLEGAWDAGTYFVHVGSFSGSPSYSLNITEFTLDDGVGFESGNGPPPKPQAISSQLRITEVPDGGSATLYPGFTPDPYVMSFVAGGSEQASQYGLECLGNVNSKPDHVIYLGEFSYLKMEVASQADTTLVVYGEPYDQWFCNDDSNGFNPLLEGDWAEGFYYVYVGSFNGKPSYDLNITEIP